MKKDKELEELFLKQKPYFTDNADFTATLIKRLNAVELVRQRQEAVIRHYKMAMIAAFVVGIISGGITVAYVLSTPIDTPLFTFNLQSPILLWLTENSRLIATTALTMLMTLGITSIISNVYDILRMQA